MGSGINKLTARKVATAKTGKYMDGGGLHLQVTGTGNKKWRFRYTLDGKRRELHVGTAATVGLADARWARDENRKRIMAGSLPLAYWDLRKLEERALSAEIIPTFTSCAAQYIKTQRRSWKNRKHAHQWISTLKTYARPIIGNVPVNEINTDHIQRILIPIWYEKTETAKRVQTRIENILDYAVARNLRDPMNPARWRGHLDKLLPNPTKVKTVQHHAAMDYRDLPRFMQELQAMNGTAPLALQFLILTATRTSEVLGARWDEIERDTWTIPPERMKAKREHRVPLSRQALAILDDLPRPANNEFLFPGKIPGKPLSNMSLLTLMRKLGYGKTGDKGYFVPHGFRSSFRDWSGEVSNYPRDVCEMALAHTIPDKVEAAYRRGSLFEKRRVMMQEWATFATK